MNVKLAGSRRLAGIAAMSAVALTLAACGNGDTSDASTPGSSSTDAGAIEPESSPAPASVEEEPGVEASEVSPLPQAARVSATALMAAIPARRRLPASFTFIPSCQSEGPGDPVAVTDGRKGRCPPGRRRVNGG